MKIGLFGGSFDPIHNGHLSLIRGALNAGCVDVVIVIPVARNSFKRGRALSAAPYRFYMTREVIAAELSDHPVFISDIEFFIDGISYTANTLERLCDRDYIVPFLKENGIKDKKAEGEHSFYWITGSDILPTFDRWYMPEKILEYADLLVASRPGDGVDIDKEAERLFELFGKRPVQFDISEVDAASSVIRKTGIYSDVPDSAMEFIRTHDLYPSDNVIDRVSEAAAEAFLEYAIRLYPYLGEKRLLHTINVGILSARYAFRFGADADKALIAGILHDCAKELPIEVQRQMAQERAGDTFDDKKLYHSPAGAVFAGKEFGIEDRDILDAITYHTTGCADMSTLSKIVFLADKLEPARTYTDLTEIRKAAETDLDQAVRLCVTAVREKFESKGRDIHPLTRAFMVSLGME